jgi:hypothetical protein
MQISGQRFQGRGIRRTIAVEVTENGETQTLTHGASTSAVIGAMILRSSAGALSLAPLTQGRTEAALAAPKGRTELVAAIYPEGA